MRLFGTTQNNNTLTRTDSSGVINTMDLNIIDLIMGLVLVAGAINGFRKGIISQLSGVAGVLLGVWLAFKFGSQVGGWLGVEMSDLVAYILVFVAALLAAWLMSYLSAAILRTIGLGIINRLGGLAVSVVFSSLILSLALGFFEQCNQALDIVNPEVIENSVLSGYVEKLSDVVFPYLEDAKEAILNGADAEPANVI